MRSFVRILLVVFGAVECLGGLAGIAVGFALAGSVTTTNDGTGLGSMLVFLGGLGVIAGAVLAVAGLGLLLRRAWGRWLNLLGGLLLSLCALAAYLFAEGPWPGHLAAFFAGALLFLVMLLPPVKRGCRT